MKTTPLLLGLLAAGAIGIAAATSGVPVEASAESSSGFVQEKTPVGKSGDKVGDKSKDTKKAEKAETITVWILDAAGKG